MKCIFFILFSCVVNISFAQNIDLGTWNLFNVKYNMDKQWSVFGETQLRSLKFYDNFHYYEYKAGINYKINNHVAFTVGVGSYQTYKEGGDFVKPKNNDETRLWLQIILTQSISTLKIEQRYRSECRFTSNGYRNRFRYRLGLQYPFGKKKNNYQPFLLTTSNEIFFTNNEPYFERNRLQFSFNYKPSLATTLQFGYIHQFDYKINDETGRDFLQLGFFIEMFSNKSLLVNK